MSNTYQSSHRPSFQDDMHEYDDVPLFQMLEEDIDILQNPNVREALVPWEKLQVQEEIGQGL